MKVHKSRECKSKRLYCFAYMLEGHKRRSGKCPAFDRVFAKKEDDSWSEREIRNGEDDRYAHDVVRRWQEERRCLPEEAGR